VSVHAPPGVMKTRGMGRDWTWVVLKRFFTSHFLVNRTWHARITGHSGGRARRHCEGRRPGHVVSTMEHPNSHSLASASSAAGPRRARAAGIERAGAAGLERTRETVLERARAAAPEGARRLPGILAKMEKSARHRRRLAQAICMNYAATMASDEATKGTRSKVFRLSTAADGPVSADKATQACNRTATDGGVTDVDVDRQQAKVEAKVEVHKEDAAS